MKERPILFSGSMVRALLERRKTQTRRIFKLKGGTDWIKSIHQDGGGNWIAWSTNESNLPEFTKRAYPNGEGMRCPYGTVGDRLWVREGFGFTAKIPVSSHAQAMRDRFAPPNWMAFRADDPLGNWCWHPSIHMPRWASRITLEITDIRVQRLQEISEEDAVAEGMLPEEVTQQGYDDFQISDAAPIEKRLAKILGRGFFTGKLQFGYWWDSINAKQAAWGTNPWCWCITFKRL